MFFFNSPLEQFEILPLIPNFLGVTITNETIILIITLLFIYIFFKTMFKQTDSTLFLVPHRWQVIIEIIYKMVLSLVTDNISGDKGQFFFPLVFKYLPSSLINSLEV